MKNLYGIYGASGFGRGVIPLAQRQIGNEDETELVFIDDAPPSLTLNGYRVLTYSQWLAEPAQDRYVSIAIADSRIREKLAENCRRDGAKFFDVRAENVVELDSVSIGEGAILCPFVMLDSNCRIGRHFHANYYSLVAHDCVIGDFVTFGPGVRCNGNVVIEEHAYIGCGALIRQGTPEKPLVIGKGAVVGMGAVVTRDVPAGVTVVGNPARPQGKIC